MKILTVVCGLGIGGTERTAENFSIGLMRCGYDVKVYASSEGGERAEICANWVLKLCIHIVNCMS